MSRLLMSLDRAEREARRGKRTRPDVALFELTRERQLATLRDELAEHTYRPAPYHVFTILVPKTRTIAALYEVGAVSTAEVRSTIFAWIGHARHGHTRALCQELLGDFSLSRPE